MQEVVLATHQDAFFAETQYANFGEMAEHINAALSEFRVSDIAARISARHAARLGLCNRRYGFRTRGPSHSVRWPVGHDSAAHRCSAQQSVSLT